MKKFFAYSSIAALLLLIISAVININPQWKHYQKEYKKIAREKIKDETILNLILDKEISLQQNYIESFRKKDRCIACHLGIENPYMADVEQPFRRHPGNILEIHPSEKYGCTICHEGQGVATNTRDAHGIGTPFVERPMLTGPFIQSSCMKCHRDVDSIGAEMLSRGKRLFAEEGCQNCHRVKGKGGNRGPELTYISDASIYIKHATEENLHEYLKKFNDNYNIAYIFESISFSKAQPENSAMVDYNLNEDDALAISVYLKGLTSEDVPASFIPDDTVESPAGSELFLQYCSVCHGKKGEGTRLAELGGKVGPAIGNQQFLAIADTALLKYIITNSKGGPMPAWGTTGGLNENEIDKIVAYVKTLRVEPPSFNEIAESDGNPVFGEMIFMANCSGCHGIEGRYETDLIGPTLYNPQLLSMATRRFWYNTLTRGREGTAMPSWNFLGTRQIADVISYLESWKTRSSIVSEVHASSGSSSRGEKNFKMYCSGCHGKSAEGTIGPSLRAPQFLKIAGSGFLYKTIIEGRAETAMPSFSYLPSGIVADIVAYLKSLYSGPEKALPYIKVSGSEYNGERIFSRICAQCHGLRGKGGIGPAIGRKGFLGQVSDSFLKEMISYGRSGTQMRANLAGQGGLVELSRRDIDDTIAYIRTLDDREDLNPAYIEGDVLPGKERFIRFCGQCHGLQGEGGIGPAIGKTAFLNSVTDGFIQAMVTRGRDGTEMRSFTETGDDLARLDETELANIIAYLRSQSHQVDGVSKSLTGTPISGKILFERNCAQCHGDGGVGSYAPELGTPQFLRAASDSYLQATMALGRHQTLMKPMIRGGAGVVELASREVNDIISYLRTLQGNY